MDAVARMQERERKMAEKEAERRRREEEEERLKREAHASTLQELKEKEAERKQEDEQVVGFFRDRNSWTSQNPTLKTQPKRYKEQNDARVPEVKGAWVKQPDGTWGAKNKSMIIGSSLYTNPATEHYLPSEVFLDLDLNTGLRRDNSRVCCGTTCDLLDLADFEVSLKILVKLFDQYYAQESARKGFFSALSVAFNNLHHSYLPESIKLFGDCLIPMWRTIDTFSSKLDESNPRNQFSDSFSQLPEKKQCAAQMDQILNWKKESVVLLKKGIEERKKKTVQEGQTAQILMLFYDIVVNHLFQALDVPSLIACSTVCRLWNTLTNALSIYENMLLTTFQFTKEKLPRDKSLYKPTAIRLWYKNSSKRPTTGLFICNYCGQFHWAAVDLCCDILEAFRYKSNVMDMKVTEDNILPAVLRWSRKGGNFQNMIN